MSDLQVVSTTTIHQIYKWNTNTSQSKVRSSTQHFMTNSQIAVARQMIQSTKLYSHSCTIAKFTRSTYCTNSDCCI